MASTAATPRRATRRELDGPADWNRQAADRGGAYALDLPWSVATLIRCAVAATIGGIGCFTAWFVISGKNQWEQQIPAMNVAVVSAMVFGGAAVSLVLSGRRAIGLRRLDLLGQAAEAFESGGPILTVAATSARLVSGPELLHFHRDDCTMAADRAWPSTTRYDHELAGRTPCGVCRP